MTYFEWSRLVTLSQPAAHRQAALIDRQVAEIPWSYRLKMPMRRALKSEEATQTSGAFGARSRRTFIASEQ